ncbi:MAG TPA: M23 family metallopeptidase [Gemmatimonadaceae bacterium]|nr:M23 family metallopeptidase [Gemmatimonadaceae bacterium]
MRASIHFCLVLSMAGLQSTRAQIPPSIEFSVPKPPTVANSDSGAFLSYELHVTNLTAAPVTLRGIEVFDADRQAPVFTLNDGVAPLSRVIGRPGPPVPTTEAATIGAGLRAYVYLWIPVDPKHPPGRLEHRLVFQRGTDTNRVVLTGARIPVTREAVTISPPIRGEWAAFNGPSNSSGHRRLVLALEGHAAIGQRFAIDYLQVDSSGASHRGDAADNANYYDYGTELHAVADGVIAAVKDSIPQNVPGATSRAVPITMETVGGNFVAIDIGGGKYALYAHVQPGSLRVKVGDHVKRGQVVALLGNSGNSTEPHVHFQIADGPSFLAAEGLPYATDFDVVGQCGIVTENGRAAVKCTRHAPVRVHDGIPLQNELVRFP